MTRHRVALLAVLLAAGGLYAWRVERAPVYLGWDEARTAMQGYSLATSGRDMTGARTPLLFHITDPLIQNHDSATWWQPTLFYLTAAILWFAPLAKWSVRLPNIGLALANMCLVAAIARRLFRNPWYGVLAAGMLAVTPAHFFFARLAQDYYLPQTFVLLWLLCLLEYQFTDRVWLPFGAGAALGMGIFTHILAWIVMPLCVLIGTIFLLAIRKPRRAVMGLWIGFAVAIAPLAAWLVVHPTIFSDMFFNYHVVTSANAAERMSLYWDYFNPSYLFFSGGTDPMWATRRAGVFLLATVVLLPLGVWNVWRESFSPGKALLVVGLLLAPVPIVAALPEAPRYATARELLVVPFGVLISVAGIEYLARRHAAGRLLAGLLVVSLPLQFVIFARDYFGDYQQRSSYRHDAMNTEGVAEFVIAADAVSRVPAVFFTEDRLGAGKVVQWKFHLQTLGKPELWERTHYWSTADTRDVPAGSVLILENSDPRIGTLLNHGAFALVERVHDITGSPSAAILRRQ
jgi:4-amino-4-deoxy-L-arabinose transferase-like glycosyltransferase